MVQKGRFRWKRNRQAVCSDRITQFGCGTAVPITDSVLLLLGPTTILSTIYSYCPYNLLLLLLHEACTLSFLLFLPSLPEKCLIVLNIGLFDMRSFLININLYHLIKDINFLCTYIENCIHYLGTTDLNKLKFDT